MRDAPVLEPIRQAVRRWVRAERVQPHERDRLVASLYHLIPATSVEAYKRALARVAKTGTIVPIVSGPFPPYAFVDW